MLDSLSKYFSTFSHTLEENLGKEFSLSSFNNAVSKEKIIIDGMKQNFVNDDIDFPWLDELEVVTEKILAIASKARTHIKFEKDVRKSELVVKIDNYDVIETLKVPKFWKQKGGKFLPEYMYTDIYETEFAIYENRFIVNLIDKMLLFLAQIIASLYEKVKKVNRNFIDFHVPVSDMDLLAELANFGHSEQKSEFEGRKNFKADKKSRLLTTKESPYVDGLRRIIEARATLNHVLATPFYKSVKRAKPLSDADVHITNMLAGDRTYAPCYNFYRKLLTLLTNQREQSEPVDIKDYHNYVLSNILEGLNNIGFKGKDITKKAIKTVSGLVTCKKLVYTKNHLTCVLSSDSEDHIDMTFSTDIEIDKTTNMNNKRTNRVSIDLVPTTNLDYTSDQELIPYFKKKIAYRLNRKYNNAFVITTVDNTQQDDVIICSPYIYKVDANIRSMIESCIMFSEGDNYIYSHLCPVCGYYVDGELEDGNCYCANCESVYALLVKSDKNHKKSKETVWIKRLKNPEKI